MPWTTTGPASRAALTAVLLAASGLLLAGCASGSGGAAGTAPSPGATSPDAYRQCLARHGVTPAPRPSGSRGPGRGPSA
ncbi:hypothetical protein EDD96_0262 [Streptomyces sp. Ag109_G2-6]|uniref:hypothetical protein n=1 Tax=Streptomyces TaxID=1883 RepID=UPI0009A4C453|nr:MULTISPECIES: hypothetical protein [Streptomyces]RPF43753.1 hypothetical protein EDD96_0262 [Streptomyces sp. Ag109_G2-6]